MKAYAQLTVVMCCQIVAWKSVAPSSGDFPLNIELQQDDRTVCCGHIVHLWPVTGGDRCVREFLPAVPCVGGALGALGVPKGGGGRPALLGQRYGKTKKLCSLP